MLSYLKVHSKQLFLGQLHFDLLRKLIELHWAQTFCVSSIIGIFAFRLKPSTGNGQSLSEHVEPKNLTSLLPGHGYLNE